MNIKGIFKKAMLAAAIALPAAPAIAKDMPQPVGYQDTNVISQQRANAMQSVVDTYGDIFNAIKELPKTKLGNAPVDYLIRDAKYDAKQGLNRAPGSYSVEFTSIRSEMDPTARFALNVEPAAKGGCNFSVQTFGDGAKTIKGDKAIGEFMTNWFDTYVPHQHNAGFKQAIADKKPYQQTSHSGGAANITTASGASCSVGLSR